MDLLNLAAEERVNLADLSFAITDSITGQHAELAQGLFLPAAGQQTAAIISGFAPMAASSSGPVTVGQASTVNAAFLSRMGSDGVVRPAEMIYGGTSVVGIDISTFPTNTYGIFVRATRTGQTVQNRAFWSGVDASEYAQLTPTRLTASWEVRIETASPGSEWLRVGQAQVTASSSGGQGATVVVTDQRPLFFEGQASAGYAPTWGTAADRSSRQSATITSLGRMVDALKQCLVDIKGRGLQPWYSPAIGGLNVGGSFGLTDSPANNRVAVGDAAFNLTMANANNSPSVNFSSTQSITVSRSAGTLAVISGAGAISLAKDGGITTGGFTLSPDNTLFRAFSGSTATGEFSSSATGGGFLTVSSSGNDAGGSVYFRNYAGNADPSSGSWAWRMRGYADTTGIRFSLSGFNFASSGPSSVSTALSVIVPRTPGDVPVTVLQGNQLLLQGVNIYMGTAAQPKLVYPGIFPVISGQVDSNKGDGPGGASGTCFGATSSVTYTREETGGRKVIRASFNQLPDRFTVVANARRYTGAGDDQTGFSITYTNLGGAQIEFCLTDDGGDSEYGAFNYVVFAAS